MDANPVLVEVTRGNWVENRHRGAFVVMDAEGRVIARAGDTARPVFPRSAVKSLQAMAIVTSGAIERFDLSDADLAIACASHAAEPGHVAQVVSFLAKLGLDGGALECGAHPPANAAAREAMRGRGEAPTALCNNCSGKHAGMLSVARALGVPTAGYVHRDHPVQAAVRAGIETAIGTELSIDRVGTDGCSIPTWAAPLEAWAFGFARMATGTGLPEPFARGARRLFDAATGTPFFVAGSDLLDTVVMEAFGGRLMQKGGAEGVQCGAIRDRGWGYALKCDDGNMIASQVMVANLLMALAGPSSGERAALDRFARQPVRNVRGLEVGHYAATESLLQALSVPAA